MNNPPVLLILFFLIAGQFLASAQNAIDTTVLSTAQQMPEYPGGVDSLLKDISSKVIYPKACADSNIQGKVYLRFIVNVDGSVSDIQAVKSPHPLLSGSATDAVHLIGKFKPATQDGKTVRVWYSVPVIFKISQFIKPPLAELPLADTGIIDLGNIALEDPKVFTFVEQNPEFPGGDRELIRFLQNTISYPQYERDRGIDGKVLTRFVVMEDGTVGDINVIKSVSPGLDKEAVRVISMFPRFKPGMQQGKPVRVYFNLPVVFKISNNDEFYSVGEKGLFDYYDGDYKGAAEIMQSNMNYPKSAETTKTEALIKVQCKFDNNLKLVPEKVLNDIDSMFASEALRLVKMIKPFKEGIRKSMWATSTVDITVEFVFDKRHRYNGSGGPDASSANRLTKEGAGYFENGKYDKAIESFDAAIRYYSIHSDAFYNRALTRYKQNDLPGACDDFRRAYLLGAFDAQKGIEISCK